MKKAVILLSGGLDSATCLALARSQGFECHTLAFYYHQRHRAELQAAQKLSKYFGAASHRVVNLESVGAFGGSALTDRNIAVPEYIGNGEIPVTYVPARNTIFLSIALGLAEVLHAQDIFIGVSSVDYSGYPDCRPDYIQAFQNMARFATKAAVEGDVCQIHTPLIYLSKAETIKLGLSLGVDYRMTVSCYQANELGEACGTCDSCVLRKKGFEEVNCVDPTAYSQSSVALLGK